jgi:hypothetical protein
MFQSADPGVARPEQPQVERMIGTRNIEFAIADWRD